MEFKDLTPEQREKAKACKTPEDILALAREEGYELTDDELDGMSGGLWGCSSDCSKYVPEPSVTDLRIDSDYYTIQQ